MYYFIKKLSKENQIKKIHNKYELNKLLNLLYNQEERIQYTEEFEFLNVEEAFEITKKYLPMHPKTFTRKIREGIIPALVFKGKKRNTYRIPKIQLLKSLEGGEIPYKHL